MLENVVPRIVIEKITLETSERQISLDINPHIDHEREPDMMINPTTGKLERRLVSTNLERKVRAGHGKLSVVLDLTMIESQKNGDDLSLWFSDLNLVKFFKVRMLCSETKEGTGRILSGYSNLTRFYQPGILSKEISLNEVVERFSAGHRKETTNSDGSVDYQVPFTARFDISAHYPQHLSVFVIPFLDVRELGKEMGFGSRILDDVQGVVSAETIIEDGKSVSNSYYFVDAQETIWTGSVTALSNGAYVSGNKQDEDSIPLFLRTMPNSKVQDFRDIADLEKRVIDFGLIDDSLASRVNAISPYHNSSTLVDIDKNKAYLTDLHVARDAQGCARFLFGIDIRKVARENLLFGKLVRENTINELGKYLLVKNVKVKRVRVKDSKDAIKDASGLSRFDINESEELIAYSGESSPNKFAVGKGSSKGALREVFLPSQAGQEYVRYFTGIDLDMAKVTFGVYQYGVEIEFEDRTLTALYEKLRLLRAAYEGFKQYYSNLTTPGNFSELSDTASPAFVQRALSLWSRGEKPWVSLVTAYLDVASLLFDGVDVEKLAGTLLVFSNPETGTVSAAGKILSLAESLLSKFSQLLVTKMSVSKRLSNMNTSAKDSRMRSRSNLPSRAFHYEKYFGATFDSDLPKNVGLDFLSLGPSKKQVNDDGLFVVSSVDYGKRVEKETLKYFTTTDADITIQDQGQVVIANDKLEKGQFSYVTPSVIHMSDQMKIATLDQGKGLFEEAKYNVMATQIAKFNFLKQSPQIVPKAFVPSEASMLNSKEQQIKENINVLLLNKGVEIRPATKTVFVEKLIEISEEEKGKMSGFYVSAESALGTGSLINKEGILKDNFSECGASLNGSDNSKATNINAVMLKLFSENSTRSVQRIAKFDRTKAQRQDAALRESIKFYDVRSKDNVVDYLTTKNVAAHKSSETVKKQIRDLPNQVKSLLMASVNSSAVRKDWNMEKADPISSPVQSLMFKMNYNMINQVDVFVGFEKDEKGDCLIGASKWEKMTQEKFNESVNKTLLCRMQPYVNQEVGIYRQKAIELPMFNEYFLLSPVDKIQPFVANLLPPQRIEKIKEKVNSILGTIGDNRKKYASSLVMSKRPDQIKDQKPMSDETFVLDQSSNKLLKVK